MVDGTKVCMVSDEIRIAINEALKTRTEEEVGTWWKEWTDYKPWRQKLIRESLNLSLDKTSKGVR